MDGAIYDWGFKDISGANGIGIKREGESILKSCSYTCAITTPDGKSVFAVGSDKTLKVKRIFSLKYFFSYYQFYYCPTEYRK